MEREDYFCDPNCNRVLPEGLVLCIPTRMIKAGGTASFQWINTNLGSVLINMELIATFRIWVLIRITAVQK